MASKYTPATLNTVHISSSVLLSLLRHTSEHYPQLFSGALLMDSHTHTLINMKVDPLDQEVGVNTKKIC